MAARIPGLTKAAARAAGLLPQLPKPVGFEPTVEEVVVEGKTDSVPVAAVGACEHGECDNPKKSNHPRVKYCEQHADPKSRKE